MSRLAEKPESHAVYHVVRDEDRYACGTKRVAAMAEFTEVKTQLAHEVASNHRCLRIGCTNDYAKADREARS